MQKNAAKYITKYAPHGIAVAALVAVLLAWFARRTTAPEIPTPARLSMLRQFNQPNQEDVEYHELFANIRQFSQSGDASAVLGQLKSATPRVRDALFADAATRGSASVVKVMLDAGMITGAHAAPSAQAGVAQPTPYVDSALAIAAAYGYDDIARMMLSHGARPNGPPTGWPPLALAAEHGETTLVRLLVQAGAQVNRSVPASGSAMIQAPPRSEAAVAAGAAGMTPLMLAANFGHADTVKLLLRHGARASQRDAHGLTALELCTRGQPGLPRSHAATGDPVSQKAQVNDMRIARGVDMTATQKLLAAAGR